MATKFTVTFTADRPYNKTGIIRFLADQHSIHQSSIRITEEPQALYWYFTFIDGSMGAVNAKWASSVQEVLEAITIHKRENMSVQGTFIAKDGEEYELWRVGNQIYGIR